MQFTTFICKWNGIVNQNRQTLPTGDILKQENKRFNFLLSDNIKIIKDVFENDSILRQRQFSFCGVSACLFYFDGMINVELVNESVIKPLMEAKVNLEKTNIAAEVAEKLLYASEVKQTSSVEDSISSMLYGDTLLLLENSHIAITVNTKGWRTRGISEPENERVLQGPREGFDEAAMFNVSMLRRRLKTPDFKTELVTVGSRTNTLVFVCYLGSLVNRQALRELKFRLSAIDTDSVLDSNYITEQIGQGRGLFKRAGATERPDIVAARLLEGRIALVVDSTPVVITLPYLFSENFQADEDYYINNKLASASRMLRMLCFFLAVVVPAFYVALTTHHFDFLPSAFAQTISVSRAGVPFPTVAEAFLLTLIFEILRETGLRMPQSVGHALSIVGGLVVGQSAVEAKIVSAPMLIAVALSGICGLMVPRLKTAVFYLRFIFIASAALFGLYGIIFTIFVTLYSIFNMESLGIDATLSLNNPSFQSFKDVFFRTNWKNMITRPKIQTKDRIRKKL